MKKRKSSFPSLPGPDCRSVPRWAAPPLPKLARPRRLSTEVGRRTSSGDAVGLQSPRWPAGLQYHLAARNCSQRSRGAYRAHSIKTISRTVPDPLAGYNPG